MKYGYDEYANVFKALGDKTRLEILALLIKGRICACKILEAFNFTQPTLSYHMKQLTESGIINAEKNGKWVYYSINCEKVDILREFMAEINYAEQTVENCCK